MKDAYLWPITATTDTNGLMIAECSVAALAQQFGTPLYLMDKETVLTMAQQFTDGFASYAGGATVYYACKALLNIGLAQLLAQAGMAFDVVSLGEFQIVKHAGVAPDLCHLHGNAKPYAEIEQAMLGGIGRIVVDNAHELETVIALAARYSIQQQVLLRIAPNVSAGGNEKIQTGKATSKFGFNIEDGSAIAAIKRALSAEFVTLHGLHAHTGSQIRSIGPLQQTLHSLFALADVADDRYRWRPRELSPGGGLAVPINGTQAEMSVADYCRAITDTVITEATRRGWPLPHLSIEPGRSLIARSVVAVYTVNGSKPQTQRPAFLHLDGGLGDNVRPAMYGARYDALSVSRPNDPHTTPYQLAGRYCESGDILIPHARLPVMQPNDLIALPAAGAYTLSMASNYNGIGRPPLILLDAGQARIIQRRETWQDIVSRDLPLMLQQTEDES